ncbi:hypothetical protein QR77_41095 [Streptomyces sp. 150FB]|nr:hypothetical protein QR77_41095 [Streptomyces sp. 150FB]
MFKVRQQAAICSLRRAVQRISSCGTPATSMTGQRPAVTVRGSETRLSASHASEARDRRAVRGKGAFGAARPVPKL